MKSKVQMPIKLIMNSEFLTMTHLTLIWHLDFDILNWEKIK